MSGIQIPTVILIVCALDLDDSQGDLSSTISAILLAPFFWEQESRINEQSHATTFQNHHHPRGFVQQVCFYSKSDLIFDHRLTQTNLGIRKPDVSGFQMVDLGSVFEGFEFEIQTPNVRISKTSGFRMIPVFEWSVTRSPL